ncbi:MAG: transketolase, partial [Candidatus Kerfeldbacteria bacterium]|nr:transketolase [Candidatus Kerfeldbacteria bacterium]
GLSAGLGMALAARIGHRRYRTYVLLGDSELAEGSVWEAFQLAGHRRTNNLTAIVDVNRLGQSGPTMTGHKLADYRRRISSFGWRVIMVNGHDFKQLRAAYRQAIAEHRRPTCILAKTIKGQGVDFLENKNGWHGRTLSPAQLQTALSEIGAVSPSLRATIRRPLATRSRTSAAHRAVPISYPPQTPVATRMAIAKALVRLGPTFPNMVVLDAEVKNSTYTENFEQAFPGRFIEAYIAEQNMIGIANGLAARGLTPVATTFAAFLTRGFDQLRMAQYSGTHQVFVGTHAGVSIGPDGPSQMGLEDIAMFRTLGHSTILYPGDAVAAERLTELALRGRGLVYLRGTRAATPLLYKPTTKFRIGGSQTLRSTKRDRATLVAAGITLGEAIKAADQLAVSGIAVRVIDLYSIKPIDSAALRRAVLQTKHLLVIEDHRPEGGIGEAVRSALGPLAGHVNTLAVATTPHSATMSEALSLAGISADHIARRIRAIIKKR